MLILLIVSVISANRTLMYNAELSLRTEALTATATIANDLLDEILNKRFDQFSDTTGTQSKYSFSPPTANGVEWGPSSAERAAAGAIDSSSVGLYRSILAFDDVDDYIGYIRMVTVNNISGFVARVTVFYVNSSAPDTPLTEQNTYKSVIVSVEHPLYLTEPIRYSTLISY